jgi:hypothetical protein
METPINTNGSIVIEPIKWPRAKIGRQLLEVRWGIVAEYLISVWGLEVDELLALYRRKMLTPPVFEDDNKTIKIPPTFEPMPPHWLVKFFDLFAACVGHGYVQMGQDPPRGSYWVTQVDEDENQFPGLFMAVTEAMGKRQAEKEKKEKAAQPTPPEEAKPEPALVQ